MAIFNEDLAETYWGVLEQIAANPPSDRVIDPKLVSKIQFEVQSKEPRTAVKLWNLYKECLDLSVRYSLTNGFMLRLFDLEGTHLPPEGAFSQHAKNMDQAPWRQEEAVL